MGETRKRKERKKKRGVRLSFSGRYISPPQPLLSETCWHVDVASRRKRWGGRERKVNTREERNGGWWLEAGERKEK